jgi:ABC-2 type transport system ATP-binding protein
LLARPDSIRLTMPPLPRQSMERLLEMIRRDVAEDKVKIDTPTQNLESYFLEVVQKARQNAAETSGATSGNRVAAYLRGDGERQADPAARILERLTQPLAAKPADQPEAAPVSTVDQGKLEALAKPSPIPAPVTPADSRTASQEQVDLAKANEKLSSLLGKPPK